MNTALRQTKRVAPRYPNRHLALRAGVGTAAASISGSFARGLLPRSSADQALTTSAAAAVRLGAGTVAVALTEALAEIAVARSGRGDAETTTLISSAILAVGCFGAVKAIPDSHDEPLPVASARSLAYLVGSGAAATTAVITTDRLIGRYVGDRNPIEGVLVAATLGAAVSALNVWRRGRRAEALGVTERQLIERPDGMVGTAQALGMGLGGGLAILGVAGAEFGIAEGTTTAISAALGRRDDPVTPLVGHTVALGILGAVGLIALRTVRRRIEHADDIVEPAYPEPPTSAYVTAGPASVIGFDTIGKEGRRFVTMALSPAEIEAVMGEPAMQPVRAVGGYEAAKTIEERAALTLQELRNLGAYDRSLIVVASPTGVGYVNYSFAEAVEYLTLGSCAIVVPQYALVPSALALNQTTAGSHLQTLVLEGIRDHIATLPEHRRPRVVQFGESLGAQVALDVAARTTADFDLLGIERGLYLGTPFRTSLWQRWFDDPGDADPLGILGMVSQADEIGVTTSPQVRHVQIVHHDDPINKFSYDTVVRTPWWMGPPESRPEGVPRETRFRPFTTFIINLVDLKNGMNSKPGQFVRRGHDYRIELREGVQRAYGLAATAEQAERIEQALRDRETEWAARRMVARRFAKARASVLSQLKSWGVDTENLDQSEMGELAAGNLQALTRRLGSSGTG